MGTRQSRLQASEADEAVSAKARILAAALDIVEEGGITALTQPRVARRAGVRQSHVTYYFPRKPDLLLAVLEASHHRAHNAQAKRAKRGAPGNILSMLEGLMFDPLRARFFFSVVLSASDDPKVRQVVAAHARGLAQVVGPYFKRSPEDPAVVRFIDLLRGMALRHLLEPMEDTPDLSALARELGL